MGPGGSPPGPGGEANGPSGGMMDAETGVMCIQTSDNLEAEVQHSQDSLGEANTVVFSGTLSCDSCSSDLTLRAAVQPGQGAGDSDGQSVVTAISVPPNSAYRLTLPKSDSPVILEVLGNDNGAWLGVKDGQGQLVPQSDRSGVDLNVSPCASAG